MPASASSTAGSPDGGSPAERTSVPGQVGAVVGGVDREGRVPRRGRGRRGGPAATQPGVDLQGALPPLDDGPVGVGGREPLEEVRRDDLAVGHDSVLSPGTDKIHGGPRSAG